MTIFAEEKAHKTKRQKMAKYPIGQQSFAGLREEGYIYVDKTGYIDKLLANKFYFLSRPRRFGKSLLLSMLECFFKGRRDLFEGLAVDIPGREWKEYPVIRIDLGGAYYLDSQTLRQQLNSVLTALEEKYGVIRLSDDNLFIRFNKVIEKAYHSAGSKVVVLIDEYEKPLTDMLDRPEELEESRRILQGFYSVLKVSDEMLKFVFITGVTKFGKMNVFSGLNNLKDISLSNEYGALCGITEDELLRYFQEGIQSLAVKNGIGAAEAEQLLKENYDGYHFSGECPDIYNPFSVLNALSESQVASYWSNSGMPSLLASVLRENRYNLDDLDGLEVMQQRLMAMDVAFTDPVPLLYQTGYLTIKGYDGKFKTFTLGFPNREVESAFFEYVLPSYVNRTRDEAGTMLIDLTRAICTGNADRVMSILEAFTAGISYEVLPKSELEVDFQRLLYLLTRLLSPYTTEVKLEERTSDGRIDLLIKTTDYIYVIEIKRDSEAEEAIKQIKEKNYALQFMTDHRKTYLIGVNYSSKKRRIDGYKIEEL